MVRARGPWGWRPLWQRPFSTYKSPKFYLSFTILVSFILVRYPDRIGLVNTVPHWRKELKESLSKPARGSLPKHGRARRRVRTKNHSLRGARGGRRRRLRGRRRGLEGWGRLRRAPRGQGCPARALEGFRGRPRDRRNLAARAAGRPGGRPSPARRARFLGDARDLRRGAAAARRRRAVRVRPPREMCTRRPKSRLRAAGRRAGDALESVRRTGPAEALGVRAAAL